jgi:hypothetical protein
LLLIGFGNAGLTTSKNGFSDLKVLPQILNGTVKTIYPFYSRNSLRVDVVKNQLLAVKHNSNRCMPAINGDILLKSIAVDMAKRLLLAACGKEKLIAWDCLGDQKAADGGSTVEARENGKALSDRRNFALSEKVGS